MFDSLEHSWPRQDVKLYMLRTRVDNYQIIKGTVQWESNTLFPEGK